MGSDSESLEDIVCDWLGKKGYRIEYLASKAFMDAGLTTIMADYVHNSEGKPREIDVAASDRRQGANPPIAMRVMCECKYSANNPWVLMASGLYGELFADWVSLPQSGELRKWAHKIDLARSELLSCWHFAAKQPFGHNIVQAFGSDNRDPAYDSLQKIANAAWDWAETPERKGHKAYLVAMPCLVVEAPILFAYYDFKESRFSAKQIPYGRLSWAGCRSGTVVDVIHVDALPKYAKAVKLSFRHIFSAIDILIAATHES